MEFSVERCGVGLTFPWVVFSCGETTSIPEALGCEINSKDLISWVIKIGIELLLIPVETVNMEFVSERFCVLIVSMSLGILVLIPVGSPVES
jgi:hypothetical protein